ncbi:uncharacterized protein BDW70DRAFT_161769 [Aspergillus foveolatus]|uniref:uncharacterized protein n=1 Tax=Aspergillus foveolatus TaxID=210207 RepID=UPI003CCE3CD4
MDNLLPLSNPHRHLEIPFFDHEVYDNLGFFTYPDRRGWDPYHLREGNYGQRSSIEAASFAQAWLFFGTISEVTSFPVRGTNFIRVSDPGGRLLVTAQRLHFYLDIWRARATSPTRSATQKRTTRERAKICLQFMIKWTVSAFLVPEHPEVAVSIEILLVILVDTFKELYGPEAWNVPSAFANPVEDRDLQPGMNQHVNGYLSARMVTQGWCPHRVRSFAEVVPSDALYTLSLMGTRDLLNGHDRCKPDACVGNYVDERTYNKTPRHVKQGCDCSFVRADVEKAIAVIEQGQIPLATAVMDSEKEFSLEITPYKPGMTYIAISHVWTHGLGNPDENALRRCQLRELVKLLKRTHEDQDLGDTGTDPKNIYFWIDTLCLPLRPSHSRKAGIKQMRHCYEAAAAVLVLDKHLRRSTIYTPSITTELLLQVAISDWRFRVWTLQEAIFAKKLIFQFLDGPVDAEELILRHVSSPAFDKFNHVNLFLMLHLLPALGFDTLALNDGIIRVRHTSLLSLFFSLQGRAISKPEDEPLCAASLLGQDNVLSEILHCPKEDRMKEFWRAQGRIPAWVVFIDGPKIDETGYRWAPSTLRYKFQSVGGTLGTPVESDVLAQFEPDIPGLRITRPGFLLLKQEEDSKAPVGAIGHAFSIRDDRGHRYDVARSTDKFNPELPELGGDIAVIVSGWPKPKGHHPQVLVVSVTRQAWDQVQTPNLIRGRIVCRGIIIVEETFPLEEGRRANTGDFVYLDPVVYEEQDALCEAPCVLIFPPSQLPSPTTIDPGEYTTSLLYCSTTETVEDGQVVTVFVTRTTTTTLDLPAFTTDEISYSNVNISRDQEASSLWVGVSINDPVSVTLDDGEGGSTTRVLTLPSWPAVTRGPPSRGGGPNMVRPVLFSQAVAHALDEGDSPPDFVIEVGPHPALKGPVQQNIAEFIPAASNVTSLAPCIRGSSSFASLSNVIGSLWETLGAGAIDITRYLRLFGLGQAKFVKDLPTYPFDHSRSCLDQSRMIKNHLHKRSVPIPFSGAWNRRVPMESGAGGITSGRRTLTGSTDTYRERVPTPYVRANDYFLGAPDPDLLPPSSGSGSAGMSAVDVDELYAFLAKVGYGYSGVFRGIRSLYRRKDASHGEVQDILS